MKQECYEFIKGPNNKVSIVGFGSYGQVKLARNTQTGQMVAIKLMYGRNAKQEIDVHHKLSHPNIIKLLNYNYDKEKNVTYMVLQYAQSGTLHNKIKFGYGQLPKDKVKRYFRDVCKGVEYLHSLKYMHRDIKPQNILLTKDDHAKLCDFGFAAILEYRSTLCGTYEYMAPQMIQEKPYDYKVDIWALGILLFQLIQGSAPFRGQSGQDVIHEMKKPIVFSNRFEKEEIQLIKKILRVNAQNRPTVKAILEHPYLSQENQEQKLVVSNTSSRAVSNLSIVSSSGQQRQNPKTELKPESKIEPKSHYKYQIATSQFMNGEKQEKIGNKQEIKDFKPYIPQGVKTNTMQKLGKNSNFYSAGISNYSQPFQPTTAYNSTSNGQNTSIDSSVKQQQKSFPSFLAKQQPTVNQKPGISNYEYQPIVNPQNKPIIPMNNPLLNPNIPPQPNVQPNLQNVNMWKKHSNKQF